MYLGLTGQVSGWSKTYGGFFTDEARSVIRTSDGGDAVAGTKRNDVWLFKTDMDGNLQWERVYAGADNDVGYSMVQTEDSGYAIAGWTFSLSPGSAQVWLIKTDSLGNMIWNKTYGGTSQDTGYCVVETGDGYAIAGASDSFTGGDSEVYLVKTDINGNMKWSKTFGGSNSDWGYSIITAPDGGYAIAATTASFGAGGLDALLIKTDANGNMQWNKTYGGGSNDYGRSIASSDDEGYAIAGYAASYGGSGFDGWLIETDANGNQLWNKTYGGISSDYIYSIVQTTDGYALAGHTRSFGAGTDDMWLVKVDTNGNLQWQKTYGRSLSDHGYSLALSWDGGLIVAGQSPSFSDSQDGWVVKTDIEGDFGLAWTDSTANTLTLYRGTNDVYWNYARVRIWKID